MDRKLSKLPNHCAGYVTERQRLELQRQRLELQRQRLELHRYRTPLIITYYSLRKEEKELPLRHGVTAQARR